MTMKLKSFLLVVLLPFIAGCGRAAVPSIAVVDSIIIDMPHGWHRIHVFPDGSGAYGFGALPEMGGIADGTFDFDSLHRELAQRVAKERDGFGNYGTVQFCRDGEGCGDLYYFYDMEFADELFTKAFANRTGKLHPPVGDNLEVIDRIWKERQS